MDQKALAVEDAVYCVRYVTAYLTHPQTIRMRRNSRDCHLSSRQIDEEEDQIAR